MSSEGSSAKAKKKSKSKGKSKSKNKTAKRRLMKDFKALSSDPPQGISATPINGNIFKWQAVIFGPEATAWEGGI